MDLGVELVMSFLQNQVSWIVNRWAHLGWPLNYGKITSGISGLIFVSGTVDAAYKLIQKALFRETR